MAETEWKWIKGNVCAPLGFRANGVCCGIKRPELPKLDLALLVSDEPCVAAGMFTRNRVKAAPVRVSQARLKKQKIQAIIANSGNANACTGKQGMADAERMTQLAAEATGLSANQILVASTGLIGAPLPMERIEPKVAELAKGLQRKRGNLAAEAIMTSDTKPKEVAVEVKLGETKVKIGAIAKGAGMIRPDMATMLAFVTTDARIQQEELTAATKEAVDQSFHRITVDGDMSTNDTVFVLANGMAGGPALKAKSKDLKLFTAALSAVMLELAKKMVRDGERVTKFVEVKVNSAKSEKEARQVAQAVANSLLVKCAWSGGDPNWGRVMHAIGYSGAPIDETTIDIYFGGVLAAKGGLSAGTPLPELLQAVEPREFELRIELHRGKESYSMYSSDITPEFVDFNREEYSMLKAMKL